MVVKASEPPGSKKSGDGREWEMEVESVEEGSHAEQLGIRPGFKLLAINGQNIATRETEKRLLEVSFGDESFGFTVDPETGYVKAVRQGAAYERNVRDGMHLFKVGNQRMKNPITQSTFRQQLKDSCGLGKTKCSNTITFIKAGWHNVPLDSFFKFQEAILPDSKGDCTAKSVEIDSVCGSDAVQSFVGDGGNGIDTATKCVEECSTVVRSGRLAQWSETSRLCECCAEGAVPQQSTDVIQWDIFVLSCEDHSPPIDGGGWSLVRHSSASSWHTATDQLVGTSTYGDRAGGHNGALAWSIKFDNTPFDEFLFATGDEKKWLIASKEQVLPEYYSESPSNIRTITKSSESDQSSLATWERTKNVAALFISLTNLAEEQRGNILYAEDGWDGPRHKSGANVFIREASAKRLFVFGKRSSMHCPPGSVKISEAALCKEAGNYLMLKDPESRQRGALADSNKVPAAGCIKYPDHYWSTPESRSYFSYWVYKSGSEDIRRSSSQDLQLICKVT